MISRQQSAAQKTSPPSELVLKLLENRGITKAEDIENFLTPVYDRDIHDPFLLHDMEKAVTRIIHAIEGNELIIIYADYDADGIPGAVIFSDFFKKIGYENFAVYIPHRHDEGYGLHDDAVINFIQDKVKLLITVDLGITAIDEIARAQANGMDVIVTDHHEAGEKIPDALAVVNPKLGNYPDRMLCGAAVAWKVVCAVLEKMRTSPVFSTTYLKDIPPGWEKWLLDMVGIATLSDMVPLVHENRALASYGLLVLRKTNRLGLVALLKKMYIQKETLLEEDITFMITPRINAASRMAHPMDAFKLLATHDVLEAQMMTVHLVQLNEQRKKLVATTMREVNKKLQDRTLSDVIVIGSPDWQAGILGLVAGKITEEYKRPAFVWSRENGHIKGSCRSYGSCSVYDMMTQVPDGTFLQYGGHKEAGGFTTTEENIHDLEKLLLAVHTKDDEETSSQISYDTELTLADISYRTYQDIRRLAPFGVANPKPQFLFSGLEIIEVRQFGKQHNHIELTFKQQGATVKAIAFFSGENSFSVLCSVGTIVSCIAHIEEETFGRKRSIRLRIVDVISS